MYMREDACTPTPSVYVYAYAYMHVWMCGCARPPQGVQHQPTADSRHRSCPSRPRALEVWGVTHPRTHAPAQAMTLLPELATRMDVDKL